MSFTDVVKAHSQLSIWGKMSVGMAAGGRVAIGTSRTAHRHDAARHPALQRLQRSHSATEPFQRRGECHQRAESDHSFRTAKIGPNEFAVRLNRQPPSAEAFNNIPLFDQSIFVRAAIQGVLKEAIVAAALTGLMILLFLGSWRSTVIVCISIPLSMLTSLAVLNLLGESINVMTLGGLALAVGILVDDATVEIENIHRNLGQPKPIIQAILDGAICSRRWRWP